MPPARVSSVEYTRDFRMGKVEVPRGKAWGGGIPLSTGKGLGAVPLSRRFFRICVENTIF